MSMCGVRACVCVCGGGGEGTNMRAFPSIFMAIIFNIELLLILLFLF